MWSNRPAPLCSAGAPLVLLAAALAFTACSDDPSGPVGSQGFRGPYALDRWTASSIQGGATAIAPASGEADTAEFSYGVHLGNPGPGVSHRTASFQATAARSGTVTLDWVYRGYHAFFLTNAVLIVFAETAAGRVEIVEIDQEAGGGFVLSGSTTIDVEAGRPFGVVIGGSNFDSDSRLNGTLKVFNFGAPS